MIKKKTTKSKGGRPSKYKETFPKQAFKLCLLGSTDKQLGDFFDVDEFTINRWKKKFPKFCEALKNGKEVADTKVADSLYNRALGYSHPEDKIFCNKNGEVTTVATVKHYAPDTTACIFWLKNRQQVEWREKQEVQHSGFIKHENLTDKELECKINELINDR